MANQALQTIAPWLILVQLTLLLPTSHTSSQVRATMFPEEYMGYANPWNHLSKRLYHDDEGSPCYMCRITYDKESCLRCYLSAVATSNVPFAKRVTNLYIGFSIDV